MGARALLLSADDKVSGLLSDAIAAEACRVDRCKDIFSAVEALTRDRFDLLLIDWQEELEAEFLLQTARDLKSNRTIFAVGLVTPAQGREAMENGSDAILVKPFTAAQAAEMLLPKLGLAALPVDVGADSRVETNPAPEGPRAIAPAPVAAANVQITRRPTVELRRPVQIAPAMSDSVSEPSRRTPLRRSRMLSLAAVVWPLIIVAALVAFDQWPRLSQQTSAQLAALLRLGQARIGRLQAWRSHTSRPATSGGQLSPEGAAIPVTGDLLSDYVSRAPRAPDTPHDQSLSQKKEDDIDLASVEALPSSSRLIAPVFIVEPSAPKREIPASLRFPPPADTARAVTPTGQLVAPGWSESPIAVPETVSRALLEHQVAPKYPDQALKMGVDGPVVLAASIDEDGAVHDLKLVSGYLVLAHAAVDAVKQWRYKPYRRNGTSVGIETLITVNFKRPPRG